MIVGVVVIFLELDSDSSEIFKKYRDNCSNGFLFCFCFVKEELKTFFLNTVSRERVAAKIT